jgi:hypothetical protein
MKIVINLDENNAWVGIQKPDCDPVFSMVESGRLSAVLKVIPDLVKSAEVAWESAKQYPKCETDLKPPAPPAPAPVRSTRSSRQSGEQQQLL